MAPRRPPRAEASWHRPDAIVAACGVLSAVALAGAGCANGRISDQDGARGTVETFLAQCAAGRGVRVLELLNRPARGVFLQAGGTARGCAAVLGARGAGSPAVDRLGQARLRLVGFDGARAGF